VLIGTDGGNSSLPGLGVHHETQVFGEDMTLPAMQFIQAATKWPAETMRVDKEVNTVEVGNPHDIPVPTRLVNANELQARVDDSLLRTPGRSALVVRHAGVADPQTLGDGTSNRGWLIVGYR
jgi:hypothetical protein